MSAGLPSPCVDVCRIDPASGWCEGCLRTIDEIAAWSALDDEGKRRVWAALAVRRRLRPRGVGAGAAASRTERDLPPSSKATRDGPG